MYTTKKERLYITDLMDSPALSYPSYYTLSQTMLNNEMLHTALIALHSFEFDSYETPKSYDAIFTMLHSGIFPLYKERYVIGYFGNKMMYLESNGWKSMPVTQEVFKLENWLVC